MNMNKIKDIIYNKSDVLVALLILAVAAAVILWRLGVILEYPKTLISSGDGEGVITTVDSGDDSAGNSGGGEAAEPDSGQTGADSGQTEPDSGTTNTTDTDAPAELWADGKLTRDVKVDVHGSYASAAVQCLVDAGLFDDYADYKSVCDAAGYNDEKVKAGEFTFKKGSTKKDIAKKINWGI